MFYFLLLPLFICQIFFDELREIKQYPLTIEIRGFLYRQEEDWVLAKEPNLKSCCVTKKEHLIVKGLKGNFSSSKAYLLKGKLKVSSHFILEDAKVLAEKSSNNWSLVLFATIGLITLMLFKKYIF